MKRTVKIISRTLVLTIALLMPFTIMASGTSLNLKLSKGSTIMYSAVSEQVINQTINGVQQIIKQNQTFEYTIGVDGNDGNGNYNTTITFKRVAIDMEMQGMKMSFDSNNESDNASANPQFLIFNALINKKVNATVSNKGKVLEVKNSDELRKQLIDALGGGVQVEQSINTALTEDALKQMFSGSFVEFPNKTLKVNDSWTVNESINNQFILNIINNITLIEEGDNENKLSISATMSTVPGNKSNMMGAEVTYNLIGTTSGSVDLDAITGMVISSVVEQNINGNIIGDMMGQKLDIPMSITSKTTVKQLDGVAFRIL